MRIILFLVTAILVSAQAPADDAADAGARLYEYFELFNSKDTESIANTIYSTPVHIGGGAGHSLFENSQAAIESLTNLYEQIEAQGWVESRISDLKICMASATLALVDTRYSRIDRDGVPIPPAIRTTLYILQKIDGDWRIVAFYGHDPDIRPGCES